MRQFGQYLTPSGSYEVSQSRDAGIRLTLIKRLYIIVAILITISLALYPLNVGAVVAEPQEITYTPAPLTEETIVLGPKIPETTQPEVTEEIVTTPRTPVSQPVYSLSEQQVVDEILKVFPDAPIMVHVARCESGLDPLADRAGKNVDVGLFQINQVHLDRLSVLGLDRRDLHDNLTYARMLYDARGLGDWYMSEHCWSKYL